MTHQNFSLRNYIPAEKKLIRLIKDNSSELESYLTDYYPSINIRSLNEIVNTPSLMINPNLQNKYDKYSLRQLANLNSNIDQFTGSASKVAIGYVLTINNAKYKNRITLLINSISSLKELRHKNLQIYVFINGGSNIIKDKLMRNIGDHFKGHVIIIDKKRNEGLAFGRNRIIDMAKSDGYEYLLFLDDDTYMIDEYLISKLILGFSFNKDIAVVGPEIVYPKSRIMFEGMNFILDKHSKKIFYKKYIETHFIEGSCHMLNLKFFGHGSVGGYYPDHYNCYWEEVLLQWRVQKIQNLKCIVIKDTRIVHIRDGGGFMNQYSIRLFTRNFLYLLKDVYGYKKIPKREYLFAYVDFIKLIKHMSKKKRLGVYFVYEFLMGTFEGIKYIAKGQSQRTN